MKALKTLFTRLKNRILGKKEPKQTKPTRYEFTVPFHGTMLDDTPSSPITRSEGKCYRRTPSGKLVECKATTRGAIHRHGVPGQSRKKHRPFASHRNHSPYAGYLASLQPSILPSK